MKTKLILLFLICFQNFLFSQIPPNAIEIKIQNQSGPSQRNKSQSNVELLFDPSGKLLKRLGYNMNMISNPKPINLVETYTYSENGLLKNVIEQEKDEESNIKPRFISKYFYNDQKQLIENTTFHYIYDSIERKTTFEYDASGNQIRINKGLTEYILKQYDNNNKCINSQLYKNNTFIENLNTPNDSFRNMISLENDKIVARDTILEAPQEGLAYGSKIISYQMKHEVVYYKNGVFKKIKTFASFNNMPYTLVTTITVKCDGKTKFDKKIIKTINREIVLNQMWE